MSATLPLFPDHEAPALERRLQDLFAAWYAERAADDSIRRSLGPRSANVYQEMWFAFAAWSARQRIELSDLTVPHLEAFMADRARTPTSARSAATGGPLSPRYVWRLLHLIDRMLEFYARTTQTDRNHAAHELLQRPEYRHANASHRDPLPDYFSGTEAARLIRFLDRSTAADEDGKQPPWKAMRDRTAVALMLGAGLTPGDVRAARVTDVVIDGGGRAGRPWKLALAGNGNAPARETPLAGWAGRLLARWMALRAQQGLGGDLLFPSTLAGKAWSHTACHDACKAVLRDAGLGEDSGGLFRLRHTFALRQLARGQSDLDVARWLGLLDAGGMVRYRRILPVTVEVV